MKSITPVISVILLILITIVASVSAFFFINSNINDLESGTNLDNYPGSDNSRLSLVSISGSKAIVRNEGTTPVNEVLMFVNGELLNYNLNTPINPGEFKEINYSARQEGEDLEIKIIYNSGKTVSSISPAIINTLESGFTETPGPLNEVYESDDSNEYCLSNNANHVWFEGIVYYELTPAGAANKNWNTASISSDGSKIIAGVSSGRLYVSSNGGTSWAEVMPAGDADKSWATCSISSDGSNIIAGVDNGRMYNSSDGGETWTEVMPEGDFNYYWKTSSMNSDGSKILAGYVTPVFGGAIFVSDDYGASWSSTSGSLGSSFWWTASMSGDGSRIVVGSNGQRLYNSTDYGASWAELRPAGDADKSWVISTINNDGSKLLAGVNNGRLYNSTDGGISWTELKPAGDANKNWRSASMNSDGTIFVVSVNNGRLYKYDYVSTKTFACCGDDSSEYFTNGTHSCCNSVFQSGSC